MFAFAGQDFLLYQPKGEDDLTMEDFGDLVAGLDTKTPGKSTAVNGLGNKGAASPSAEELSLDLDAELEEHTEDDSPAGGETGF